MGIVYLAKQKQPIERQVALKVIKAGMDSKQVMTRFEAERQILALLDHSNIAQIYDAGTTRDGRPYFSMEYEMPYPRPSIVTRKNSALNNDYDYSYKSVKESNTPTRRASSTVILSLQTSSFTKKAINRCPRLSISALPRFSLCH